MEWLTTNKIPLGPWMKAAFDWLNVNAAGFFDAISMGLQSVVDLVLYLLSAPPPLVIVALLILLTWALQRSWGACLLTLLGSLYILNQGYWTQTLETLTLVFLSCVLSMLIAVPIGIIGAHRPAFYRALVPVLDLMQTLPAFVYLIPIIAFFGLGMVPGLIATVIFVLPAPIRLTQLGIAATPPALIEAAQAFGATAFQVLWKVELPYALPQIMTGLNQAIMLSLSMVVIASLVAADGLGVPVLRALNTVNAAMGFEAGFVIVIVAVMLARMFERRKR
ncbi:MAG TPA: choline ABC transporter permease subunit [Paracoccaceae bacterium]|nr:choline ABC transporter permease subunit [Paracoccaceae bacterium]